MVLFVWIGLGIAGWLCLAFVARWVHMVRPRGDDMIASGVVRALQAYARHFHNLEVLGLEHVPPRPEGAGDLPPLIIVSNHTSGIDPLLIQGALPFEVRWVMGEDMGVGLLSPFWRYARVVFVDRLTGGSGGVRDAIAHLERGGVLGIFPEGHIERPSRRILPFSAGVGLMIRKTKATVLPVVIEGTPQVDPAWASLVRSSNSRLRFLPPIDYAGAGIKGSEIAPDLRRRFLEATGWDANETPPEVVPQRP